MEIWITDLDNGGRIQIPMLPEKITTTAGTRFLEYDIMSIGEVRVPLGEDLTRFKWSAYLPGAPLKNMPYVQAWSDPIAMQSRFSFWRQRGTRLLLCITDSPINHAVYLEEYDCSQSGPHGSIEYSISFCIAKDVAVDAKPGNRTVGGSENTAQTQNTYTVKAGDTLYKIASKTMGSGSKWRQLYEANKELIDSRNQKDGKYAVFIYTIYPGQVLTIPK